MLRDNAAAEDAKRQELRDAHKVQFIDASPGDLKEQLRTAEELWQAWARQQAPDGVEMIAKYRRPSTAKRPDGRPQTHGDRSVRRRQHRRDRYFRHAESLGTRRCG